MLDSVIVIALRKIRRHLKVLAPNDDDGKVMARSLSDEKLNFNLSSAILTFHFKIHHKLEKFAPKLTDRASESGSANLCLEMAKTH